MSDQRSSRNARILVVNTRFQQMARRPGGVTRERAIERAQHQIDDLKPAFADWLEHELHSLAASVEQLAADPRDEKALNHAHQACSQLRDVGATMGFELVTFIASNFCEILEAINTSAAYDQTIIDCHMDALLLAKTEPYRSLRPDQLPEMTSGLRRVVELATAASRERE